MPETRPVGAPGRQNLRSPGKSCRPGWSAKVTKQLGGKWLRSRFLRQARSAARAYPSWIGKRRTTKSLRKKIEPTRPIRLHGYGLGGGGSPDPAFFGLFDRRLTEDVALTELKNTSRRIFSFKYAVVRDRPLYNAAPDAAL